MSAPLWKPWRIRKGHCSDCWRDGWVIRDHRNHLYGCRPTFAEAITFATAKSAKWAGASARYFVLGHV